MVSNGGLRAPINLMIQHVTVLYYNTSNKDLCELLWESRCATAQSKAGPGVAAGKLGTRVSAAELWDPLLGALKNPGPNMDPIFYDSTVKANWRT